MKGIIVAIQGKKAVLLDNEGNFINLPNRGYRIGQAISAPRFCLRRIASVAAVFVLLCLASCFTAYYTPTSTMHLTINPDFMLSLNCFDRVIHIEALNDDAAIILEAEPSLRGNTAACVIRIVTVAADKGYLSRENATVHITADTKHAAVITKAEEAITTSVANGDIPTFVQVSAGTEEIVPPAESTPDFLETYQSVAESTDTENPPHEEKDGSAASAVSDKNNVQSKEEKSAQSVHTPEKNVKQENAVQTKKQEKANSSKKMVSKENPAASASKASDKGNTPSVQAPPTEAGNASKPGKDVVSPKEEKSSKSPKTTEEKKPSSPTGADDSILQMPTETPPDHIREGLSEFIPKDIFDHMTEYMPEDPFDHTPEYTPENPFDYTPEYTPENPFDYTPEYMPEDIFDHMTEHMPEDFSEYIPGHNADVTSKPESIPPENFSAAPSNHDEANENFIEKEPSHNSFGNTTQKPNASEENSAPAAQKKPGGKASPSESAVAPSNHASSSGNKKAPSEKDDSSETGAPFKESREEPSSKRNPSTERSSVPTASSKFEAESPCEAKAQPPER